MGLKEWYLGLEDQYYKFLDGIDHAGIPIYKIVDWIENKNIPTFPIAALIVLLVLFGVGSFVYSTFFAFGTLNIRVLDESNTAIGGVPLSFQGEGIDIASATTDAQGMVSIQAPIGKDFTISVSDSRFEAQSKPYKLAGDNEFTKLVVSIIEKTIQKKISFVDASGAIVKEPLQVEFSCSKNSAYQKNSTASNGIILLSDVPSDCGVLNASPKQDFSIQDSSIELIGAENTLQISRTPTEKGNVNVIVKDESGKVLAAIGVSLVQLTSAGNATFTRGSTSSSGTAQFANVPVGQYRVEALDNQAEFDSDPTDAKTVASNQTIEFLVTMKKSAIGFIRVAIIDDSTLTPVKGAKVELSKTGGTAVLTPQFSKEDGKVEFKVNENVSYKVSVDHGNYLVQNRNGLTPSETYQTIRLIGATEENSNTLNVLVKDERGLPLENARVQLKKSTDLTVIGSEMVTGSNGIAAFPRLELGSYFVFAFKPGFGEKTSNIFEIKPRQENRQELVIPIGSGSVQVNVSDEEQQPIAGATISAIDAFTGEKIGQDQISDAQGIKQFQIRADKKVYFVAKGTNSLPTTTAPLSISKDAATQVHVTVLNDVPKLEARLIGLFVESETVGGNSNSVNAGQKYVARFELRVPKNSAFSEAGLHIRTGNDATPTLESDDWFLKSVNAPKAIVIKGKSYSPPNGFAADAEQFTPGDAKWATIVFPKIGEGVYQVEAELQVRDDAARGSAVQLHYRAFGKAGGVVRFPVDSTLGQSENVATKNGLYAQTNTSLYSIGPSSLCSDNYCSTFTISDLREGIQTAVASEYGASVSNGYTIHFTIIQTSSAIKPNAQLKISNSTNGLAFGKYSISSVTGQNLVGNANAAEFSVPVGSMAKDSTISGSVSFNTQSDGLNPLQIELVSGQEKMFSKKINVIVAAANPMFLSTVPKTLVPFQNNSVLVRSSADEEGKQPISNTSITVTKNGTLLVSGETDASGLFPFQLNSPENNSKIVIEAKKNGFANVQRSFNLNEDIVSTQPIALKENLSVTGPFNKTRTFAIQNTTGIPLTIDSVQASADFSKYANVSINPNPSNTLLNPNQDFNAVLTLTLTDAGKAIAQPQTIQGSLNIQASNGSTSWLTRVPMQLHIGFGSEVDNADCFGIEPTTWELFSDSTTQTLDLTVHNNCGVNGVPIALRSLQLNVKGAASNTVGTFTASTPLGAGQSISLGTDYKSIADLIPAQSESTVTLTFTPAIVDSASAKAVIGIRAVNKTQSEDQFLSSNLATSIQLNQLQKCVRVVAPTQLNISTIPFNTGRNQFSQFNYSNYGNQNQLSNQNFPFGTSQNQSMDYQNTNPLASNNFNPLGGVGTSELRVENNCASAVDIVLDSSGSISASEDQFTLAAKQTKKITLESGYRVGKFKLDVSANAKGSQGSPQLIKSLFVVVNSASEVNENCISLDRTKFQFNDFIGRPISGTIQNTCYDAGVRLTRDASTIQVFEFNPQGARQPTNGYLNSPQYDPNGNLLVNPQFNNQFNQPYANYGSNQSTNMINGIIITGLTTSGQPNGNTTQTLNFQIDRSIQYIKQNPLQKSGLPFEQLGGLRYYGQSGYYRIESRGTLTVTFFDGVGGTQSKPFNIVLEDVFSAGEFLDALSQTGNPRLTSFKECINDDALVVELNDNDFDDKDTYSFTTGDPDKGIQSLIKTGPGLCGGSDRINMKLAEKKKDGINYSFRPTSDGRNIKVTVDKSDIKPATRYGVTGTLEAQLSRQNVAQGISPTQPVEIDYSITYTPGSAPKAATQGSITFCAVEDSLPNIQFEWDWEKVGEDFCSGGIYCDGTQFAIALSHKAEKLQEIGKKFPQTVSRVNDVDLTLEADKANTAKNLFRNAVNQITVTDNVSKETYNFFLSEINSILSRPITQKEQTMLIIQGDVTNNSIDNIMKTLSTNPFGKSVIAEIAPDKTDGSTFNSTLEKLGAEKQIGANYAYYVLTLKEYKRFRDALMANQICKSGTGNCAIQIGTDSIPIDLAFSKMLAANTTFKFGIRNKSGLSEDDRQLVINKGFKNDEIVSESLETIYNTNIEFPSRLITDNYNPQFTKDFETAYSADNTALKNWKVIAPIGTTVEEPGIYDILLDYSFESNGQHTVEIKTYTGFTLPNPNSAFYYLPFDGAVGGNDRKEYGVTFSNGAEYFEFGKVGNLTVNGSSGTEGFRVLDGEYSKDIKDTRNGVVLEAQLSGSTGKLLYNPSDRVKLASLDVPSGGMDFQLLTTTNSGSEVPKNVQLFENEFSAIDTKLVEGRSLKQNPEKEQYVYAPVNNSLYLKVWPTNKTASVDGTTTRIEGDSESIHENSGSIQLHRTRDFPPVADLLNADRFGSCDRTTGSNTKISWRNE